MIPSTPRSWPEPPAFAHPALDRYGRRLLEAVLPRRFPWACLGLMAVNLALFLLEEWWGGSMSYVTLKRMGAGGGPPLFGVEAWRLLSAGYLHLGWAHLLTNLGVLGLCGMYLEGLLGPSRLLLLHTVCILVPNVLAVAVFPNVLVLGASGGILGLMGALLVLACHPRTWLPLRRRIAPLVCALSVALLTFRAACECGPTASNVVHLLGTTLGMVLALWGVLTWNLLPYLGTRELSCIRQGARAAVGLTVACLGLVFVRERPWELRAPERLVRVRVPGTPLSLAVPAGAARRTQVTSVSETDVRVSYGELLTDMLVVDVTAERLVEAVSAESLERDTRALNEELSQETETEEGVVRVWGPWIQHLGMQPAVYSGGNLGTLFWFDRWSMYRGRWLLTVDVFRAAGMPDDWEPLVREVAWSVVMEEEGAPPWDSCAAWNPVEPGRCPPGGGW